MTDGRPSVSVAVMAHWSRREHVDDVLAKLDRPAAVVWDRYRHRWDTGKRALAAYHPAATHHLVIQDDALPCRELVASVEHILAYVPDGRPVGLYYGTRRPPGTTWPQLDRDARRHGHSWIVTASSPMWGVALVLPVGHIDRLIDDVDQRTHPSYDSRIKTWYARQSIEQWYPVPSLVEHRGVPSLATGRADERRAHEWIGGDVSAFDVDWTGGVTRG